MFSHSGVVSQSECIHNWSMWDWQSRNSCNIKSVGGGPVNLFTLPRPLSKSKPTHLEIFPNEMCSTLIRWDIFLGYCVSNRVCVLTEIICIFKWRVFFTGTLFEQFSYVGLKTTY